jgi:hypothetical protein
MQCESIFKERIMAERLRKLKEEKVSMKAMSQMRVFAGNTYSYIYIHIYIY